MLYHSFLCVILALVASLVAAIPLAQDDRAVEVVDPYNLNMSTKGPIIPDPATMQGWDPSFYYHNYSTIQVWMGKKKTQVGTLVGSELFEKIVDLLNKECPENSAGHVCRKNTNAEAASTCLNKKGRRTPCHFIISKINADWNNDAVRKLMIQAIAGALHAATLPDMTTPGGNCWDMGDGKKACNVGDSVRVNFPKLPKGKANYFHIEVKNWFTNWGKYQCCGQGIRAYMDMMLDTLKDSVSHEFPDQAGNAWFRDSLCVINAWAKCPTGASDD